MEGPDAPIVQRVRWGGYGVYPVVVAKILRRRPISYSEPWRWGHVHTNLTQIDAVSRLSDKLDMYHHLQYRLPCLYSKSHVFVVDVCSTASEYFHFHIHSGISADKRSDMVRHRSRIFLSVLMYALSRSDFIVCQHIGHIWLLFGSTSSGTSALPSSATSASPSSYQQPLHHCLNRWLGLVSAVLGTSEVTDYRCCVHLCIPRQIDWKSGVSRVIAVIQSNRRWQSIVVLFICVFPYRLTGCTGLIRVIDIMAVMFALLIETKTIVVIGFWSTMIRFWIAGRRNIFPPLVKKHVCRALEFYQCRRGRRSTM